MNLKLSEYRSVLSFTPFHSDKLNLFGLGFCKPKKTGGLKCLPPPPPPPNLAISSQITMKPGKDILWVEIFTN